MHIIFFYRPRKIQKKNIIFVMFSWCLLFVFDKRGQTPVWSFFPLGCVTETVVALPCSFVIFNAHTVQTSLTSDLSGIRRFNWFVAHYFL